MPNRQGLLIRVLFNFQGAFLSLTGQLIQYTTSSLVCQVLFSIFFIFFLHFRAFAVSFPLSFKQLNYYIISPRICQYLFLKKFKISALTLRFTSFRSARLRKPYTFAERQMCTFWNFMRQHCVANRLFLQAVAVIYPAKRFSQRSDLWPPNQVVNIQRLTKLKIHKTAPHFLSITPFFWFSYGVFI